MRLLQWRKLAATIAYCPVCDRKRPMIRLAADEIAVRCLACHASAVTISVAAVLRHVLPDLSNTRAYELSCRGSLVELLGRHCKHLTCSEYLPEIRPGESRNGVRSEDVQSLTFADRSFDLCTSTEVFEHVPDDIRGFREIRRVLRPAGLFVFTVPMSGSDATVERTILHPDGTVEHLLPAEYHLDPIRGHEPVLAFRTYGRDIVDRLLRAGFARAELIRPEDQVPWGYARTVVVGYCDQCDLDFAPGDTRASL